MGKFLRKLQKLRCCLYYDFSPWGSYRAAADFSFGCCSFSGIGGGIGGGSGGGTPPGVAGSLVISFISLWNDNDCGVGGCSPFPVALNPTAENFGLLLASSVCNFLENKSLLNGRAGPYPICGMNIGGGRGSPPFPARNIFDAGGVGPSLATVMNCGSAGGAGGLPFSLRKVDVGNFLASDFSASPSARVTGATSKNM